MTNRRMILASATLLALAACGRGNDTNTANTAAVNDVAEANTAVATPVALSGAQGFANTAAASDAFEIETSKLALTSASSASVKAYARKMIEAHTASTAKLKTTASGLSPALTPDPTLAPDQQAKLDQLKGLQGKAFDQAYIAEQTTGHEQTLAALKSYAATGDVPQLKTFASDLIPTVTAHLNMVKGMKA